jgi:hypothetical protein
VSSPQTLVLRYADVGVATYASLRVVGAPSATVTWAIEEPILLAALEELADALPDPQGAETRAEAIERAVSSGPFSAPDTELAAAYRWAVLLIAAPAWQLLKQTPGAVLFVAPSARLARVPWGLLAAPTSGPGSAESLREEERFREELLRARAEAVTPAGVSAARIPWGTGDIRERTDGVRLMQLVDVRMAVPPNIVHSPRTPAAWHARKDRPPLLVLDPRVPGQRPDSPLGSVLGKPSAHTPLARHFAELMARRPVLPRVDNSAELFRRSDADRSWLANLLASGPSRLLYVGHASAADGDVGHADRAALHLACTATIPGHGDPVGAHRPLIASDLMSSRLPLPPRVALLACASGGDYQFDEATGLVAAMILGGAQLVTATLWSLPTAAGYQQFAPVGAARGADPMAEAIIAVDRAHEAPDAGRALNDWQRQQLLRWCDGDLTASPVYWAALVTFTVDGAR